MKACRDCHMISDGVDACPACASHELSKDFLGQVIVINAEKSIIAKKMNIDANGKYALRVR